MQQVDENLTYDYLHSSEENLWSILYLTGYLTSVRADELENPLPERFTALTIPNEEIREIYETTVIRWLMKVRQNGTEAYCLMLSGKVIYRSFKAN